MKVGRFAKASLVCVAALVSTMAAGDERTEESVKNEFLRGCESWFWRCDCVERDLFPSAVHALKEERYQSSLAMLRNACEKGSWDALKAVGWERVLTARQFKELGFEPPASRREHPKASPCEVAGKLETVKVDQFFEVPDASLLWLRVAPQIACRNEAGIRKHALDSCSQMSSADGSIDCDCYAGQYTSFWMKTEEEFGSKADVRAGSEALYACRRR